MNTSGIDLEKLGALSGYTAGYMDAFSGIQQIIAKTGLKLTTSVLDPSTPDVEAAFLLNSSEVLANLNDVLFKFRERALTEDVTAYSDEYDGVTEYDIIPALELVS